MGRTISRKRDETRLQCDRNVTNRHKTLAAGTREHRDGARRDNIVVKNGVPLRRDAVFMRPNHTHCTVVCRRINVINLREGESLQQRFQTKRYCAFGGGNVRQGGLRTYYSNMDCVFDPILSAEIVRYLWEVNFHGKNIFSTIVSMSYFLEVFAFNPHYDHNFKFTRKKNYFLVLDILSTQDYLSQLNCISMIYIMLIDLWNGRKTIIDPQIL